MEPTHAIILKKPNKNGVITGEPEIIPIGELRESDNCLAKFNLDTITIDETRNHIPSDFVRK